MLQNSVFNVPAFVGRQEERRDSLPTGSSMGKERVTVNCPTAPSFGRPQWECHAAELQWCPWGTTPFLSPTPKAFDKMKAAYQGPSLPSVKLSSASSIAIVSTLLPAHPMPGLKELT